MWSNPALINRFEELAGFRVVGQWGSLKAIGVDATFDYIAKGTPQLHESAMGGKRMSKAENIKGLSAASARAASILIGSSGHEDHAVASGRITPFEASDEKLALRMPWSGTRSRAKRSANGRNQNVQISVELDSIPSVALSPRFEAARFLLDLLSLRGSADESRRKREARRRVSLGRSVEVLGGTSLLVAAALKGLQDEQGMGRRRRQQQQQRGFLLDQLHSELYKLCAFKLSAERVLEGMRVAPGIVQGARARYWWTFDASAVDAAIGVAEGGCEAEVDEFRGFLTRYARVMMVLTEWGQDHTLSGWESRYSYTNFPPWLHGVLRLEGGEKGTATFVFFVLGVDLGVRLLQVKGKKLIVFSGSCPSLRWQWPCISTKSKRIHIHLWR